MGDALNTRNWKSTSFLLTAVAVLAALLVLTLTDGNSARVQAQTPPDEALAYENMDPLLNEIAQQYEMGALTASAAAASAPVSSGGSVGVIFLTESGETDDIRDFLLENGASPGPAFEGFVGAEMPVSLLASASQQDGVTWMQAAIPPRIAQSESPVDTQPEHGADVWHQAGLRGEGVKVGVISHGFEGFQETMGTSLPESVEARCYVGYGAFSTDIDDCKHDDAEEGEVGLGTVAAQAVFSIAPDATYYIVHITDSIDLFAATRWLTANEVDVVNNSLMWVWSGPGDGTSPLALSALNTVDEAVAGGITWVMPAGNDAQSTWFGSFEDTDDNGFHNFDDDGEDECNRVEVVAGEFYFALLRWEGDWGVGSDAPDETDFNLYLVNEETSRVVRRSFSPYWSRAVNAPLEYLFFRSFGSGDASYCLRLELDEGDAPEWIQLQSFFGEELEHHTSHGSISSPAESANPGLMAVGTASLEDPNVIWERSSRGPAPDGRIKPEVVGGLHEGEAEAHGVEDQEYTPGTGHEAAHVAGLAVLVKQRFPEFGPEDVADYLKANADDRGEPGPDNTWGYGFATLPSSDATEPPDPDVCLQRIYGDATFEGAWDDSCLSENRPDDDEGPGDGDYYSRFYTIAVGENRRLTVSLSSDEDTFLYLLKGAGKDGEIEARNDDVTQFLNLNSRIVADNLEAGEYTIEATTYHTETAGSFTLTVEITDAGEEPAPPPPATHSATGPFSEFSRGADHACALRASGQIACWGSNDYGQASPPYGAYEAISSGENGSCALNDDGAAVCWGSFDVRPSTEDTAEGPFTEISRGSDHACALGSDGAITCWGSNRHGQATPPSGEYRAIGSHDGGSCALRDDDALVCRGSVEVSP